MLDENLFDLLNSFLLLLFKVVIIDKDLPQLYKSTCPTNSQISEFNIFFSPCNGTQNFLYNKNKAFYSQFILRIILFVCEIRNLSIMVSVNVIIYQLLT